MKNCSVKALRISIFVLIVLAANHVDAQKLQDASFKSQVNEIKGATALLNKLKPQSFVFNHQDYSYLDLPSGIQYGFNAEQVQSVMPSIVYEKSGKRIAGKNLYKNYSKKQVDETSLIPFLVASINELQNEISLLREELAQMKNK